MKALPPGFERLPFVDELSPKRFRMSMATCADEQIQVIYYILSNTIQLTNCYLVRFSFHHLLDNFLLFVPQSVKLRGVFV